MPSCPKKTHQPQPSHGSLNHGLKYRFKSWLAVLRQGTFSRLVGPRVCHNWRCHDNTKGSSTGDRWRQLTLLVNTMTNASFTQGNLSVCVAVVNPLFYSMSKRAGESFAASSSAKQWPIRCRTVCDQCLLLSVGSPRDHCSSTNEGHKQSLVQWLQTSFLNGKSRTSAGSFQFFKRCCAATLCRNPVPLGSLAESFVLDHRIS